mmetsp:Transcript_93265/g.266660  ORF Transcript_93265/g.266660 Transcript_93265/m.266660 type:complete len:273 (+) Transcript_93265:100-918(+)
MASYDASRLVDHIHNWPRYAWGEGHLVYTTNVFGFQYDNVDAGYVKGVLSLPALLLTVAVFLIISSSIFCMCRGLACVCMCCYNACGHGKSRTKGNRRHGDTDAGQSEGLMNSAYVERNSEDPYFVPDDHSTCVRIGFGVLIVLAIASVVLATCSLIGNGDVATGVRHIDHAVTTLTGLVNNLTDISDDMSELSTKVELDLNYTMQKNVCKVSEDMPATLDRRHPHASRHTQTHKHCIRTVPPPYFVTTQEFIPESEWELLEEVSGGDLWFT